MSKIVVPGRTTVFDKRHATMVDSGAMNAIPEITKEEALHLYDGNQAALGRALGVSRQAISKLPQGPLPEWMALKLRFVLRPDAFADKRSDAA